MTTSIRSTFDIDTDGWTVQGAVTSFGWQPSGGNPGGNLHWVDAAAGQDAFWVASGKFLGNQSLFFGGTLSYDIEDTGADYNGIPDVELIGHNGVTLVAALGQPGVNWTHFSVTLNDTGAWKVGSLGGAAATDEQIQQVLADVDQFLIRAEFVTGAEQGGLDNVALTRSVDTYAITPSRTSIIEGPNASITFTVTRSGDLQAETIYASTVAGAANGFSDNSQDIGGDANYTGITDQALVFALGETTKTVTVLVKNDAVAESDERFALVVQRNTGDPPATFLSRSTFTVYDNDQPLQTISSTSWVGGSGDWTQVRPMNASGWDPAVPSLSTNAAIGVHDINITYSLAGGAARLLNMADNTASRANAGTIVMSGGSLELATGSGLGGLTQTGGTLTFDNAVERPDHTLDFAHPDVDGEFSSTARTVTQSAGGTIDIVSGTFSLQGSSSISGTVTGDGTLQIDNSTTITSTATLTSGGLHIKNTNASLTLDGDRTYAGTFTLGGQAILFLNGSTFTLTGDATLGGSVHGGGKLVLAHAAEVVGFQVLFDGGTIEVSSIVTQTDTAFHIGDEATGGALQIDAGGVWNMTTDFGITLSGLGSVTNAGTLAKIGGIGTTAITGGNITSTGTLEVDTGTIQLFGTGTLGGHLTGDSKLFFSGDYTLGSGVIIDVATWKVTGTGASATLSSDITYDGDFELSGVATTLDLNGHTATFGGPSSFDPGGFGSSVHGPRTLKITGTASHFITLAESANLDVAGTLNQSSGIRLGTGASDNTTLTIENTGTYNITGGSIDVTGTAHIENAGLMEKTGSGGTNVQAVLHNSNTLNVLGGTLNTLAALTNDGSVDVEDATLDVRSTLGGTGTITIGDDSFLRLRTTVAAGATITFAGSAELRLDAPGSFAGSITGFAAGDVLDLAGETVLSETHNATTLTLHLSGGGTQVFNFSGSYTGLAVASDDNGGSYIAGVVASPFNLTTGSDIVFFASGSNLVNGTAATVNAGDLIGGGSGTDTLALTGGGTINLAALSHFAGFEQVNLDDHSYTVTVGNANLAAGKILSVNGAGLGATHSLTFNGAAETDGAFQLTGGAGGDNFTGGNGSDVLNGHGGADIMTGGGGDDFFYVDNALDVVNEASSGGNDRVFASLSYALKTGQSVDKLTTDNNVGTGAINLTGNELANIIFGNNGANSLDGKGGVDNLNGLDGDDFYYVDNALDVVSEAAGDGSDRVFTSVSYTLKAGQEIEKLTTDSNGGTGAINLTGNELANIIYGNNGANSLDGKGGVDNLNGLGGDDFYYVDDALDVINEASGGGNDRAFASVSYTLKAGQEIEKLTTDSNGGTGAINLTGNELANIIFGNAGANSLDGKGGADNLNGLDGDDFYYVDSALDVVSETVGDGSDRVLTSVSYTLKAAQEIEKLTTDSNSGISAIDLTGNDLANAIFGNAGSNRLNGGGGNDSLVGLGGADTYVFNTALNASTNHDSISDLTTAQDHIELAKSVFALLTGSAGATLAAGEFVSGAGLTNAQDANDRIVYNTTTGDLYYDSNGTAAGATLFATLANHAAVNNTSFVLA